MADLDHERPKNDKPKMERPKTVRRHGACNPCKVSKTRCDGGEPCTACRQEKRKTKTCEYSHKVQGFIAARQQQQESGVDAPFLKPSVSTSTELSEHVPSVMSTSLSQFQHAFSSTRAFRYMRKRMSLQRVVDEFVCVQPMKGRRAAQAKKVSDAWSEFQHLRGSDTTIDDSQVRKMNTASCISCGLDDSNPPLSLQQKLGQPLNGQAETFQPYLDGMLQFVNEGRLTLAWKEAAAAMRTIEFIEIESGLGCTSEDVTQKVSSTCLGLIDLECILSFFIGGDSHLPSWSRGGFLSSAIEQQKATNSVFSARITIYETIQNLLSTNLQDEEGIKNFLRKVKDVKTIEPITQLEKATLMVHEKEPAEKQELKLIANLVFVLVHCRKALICQHYEELELKFPNESPSHILDDLKMSEECGQVIKHAIAVLDTFESLCETDPIGTAGSWFRLHGALVAAALVGVDSYKDQKSARTKNKKRLSEIEAAFKALQAHNKTHPILDNASRVLRGCIVDDVLKSKASRTGVNAELASNPCRKRSANEQGIVTNLPSIEEQAPSPSSNEHSGGKTAADEDRCGPRKRKKRKVVKSPEPTYHGPTTPEHRDDFSIGHRKMETPTEEYLASVQRIQPVQKSRSEYELNSSFGSIDGSMAAMLSTDEYVPLSLSGWDSDTNLQSHPPTWNVYGTTREGINGFSQLNNGSISRGINHERPDVRVSQEPLQPYHAMSQSTFSSFNSSTPSEAVPQYAWSGSSGTHGSPYQDGMRRYTQPLANKFASVVGQVANHSTLAEQSLDAQRYAQAFQQPYESVVATETEHSWSDIPPAYSSSMGFGLSQDGL